MQALTGSISRVIGWLALLVLGGNATAQSQLQVQDEPLLVTYGPAASTEEGDPDHRQVIFLSVPDDVEESLHLRVFDADTGGEHDLVYGEPDDTEVRFALFGGDGAYSGAAGGAVEADAEQLVAGELIGERSIGPSEALDDRWQTLFVIAPGQGEAIDGRRFFRLQVEGVAGDDANQYEVALSHHDRRNLPPAGLEITDFAPTARVPDDRRLTELRFRIPPDAERLTVRNFDAANAALAFVSTYRSVSLAASGQDEWRETEVAIEPSERDDLAAITFSGGDELPNDLTLAMLDQAGRPLAFHLPARLWLPNQRPLPEARFELLADCVSVAFDGSSSTDPDGGPLSYQWRFGDGATASDRAPVHRYQGPDIYRATLAVRDSSGQIGNGAERSFEVLVKRPPTAVAGQDLVVAPDQTVAFDGSGSLAGERPIARYLWDFQDGGRAEGASTEHAFARPGRYVVTLRVDDDTSPPCNTATDQQIVRVNARPVAIAGEEQRVAAGQTVVLDGGRSYDVDGAITAHRWDLDDGTVAAGARAEHAYAAPGSYLATLTVEDDTGVANSAGSDRVVISVNAPPLAEVGPDRHVAVGEVITFDGAGSSDADGALIGYAWSFGDGAEGHGQVVQYAYRDAGVYRVELVVRDDSATDSDRAGDALTVVVNAPPVADAGPDQVVTTSTVGFDATASHDPDGDIARYEWDFGDGSQGTGPTPMHVYKTPGSYRVSLTVTDDSGTLRSSRSDSMRAVVNAAPIADAGPDLVGAPGQELTFDAAGSLDPDGDVAEYLWSFKDGAEAAGRQVTYRFDQPGVYSVRLAVRDDTAQDQAIDFDEAKVVINAPPVARAGPDRRAAPGEAVLFDAANSFDPDGQIALHRWDFSDQPEPSFEPTVVRAYAEPGVYTAQLTVTDDSAAINAIESDQLEIRINHAPAAAAGQDIVAWRTTVSFDGSESADADGDALTYRWEFGDGSPLGEGALVTHTYAEGGVYPVILTVDDGTGLWNATDSAALTVTINRSPIAVAGPNKAVCAGDVVVFDGSGSQDPEGGLLRYRWDFGDGTGADLVNPTKTYDTGGVYPVTLDVQDESGFANGHHTDRIVVAVDESPLAQAGPDQDVCAGTEVHFDGSASRDFDGVVNRFTWDLGDGTTGGGDKPVQVYTLPGNYRVLLTIEGDDAGQCSNIDTDELIVRVVEAPVAQIDGPSAVAVGASNTFEGFRSSGATGQIQGWRWDFGDGTTAETPDVEHVYRQPGRYVVELQIETDATAARCNDGTVRHHVVANAPPVADAGSDRLVAVDEEVLFDGSGASDPDGQIASWHWDFGDGTNASGMHVRHRFRTSGVHPVTLTVTDDTALDNNTASATIEVEVNAAPEPAIVAPAAACPSELVTFDGSSSRDADGGVGAYLWQFGDGVGAEVAEVTHRYTTAGRYPVALVVDDGRGLDNSRRHTVHTLHVNRPPQPMAGPDRMVCPGEPVTFDGSASVDWDGALVDHHWDFGDGTTATGTDVTHAFAEPGVYQVRLAVTDDSGASCATAVDVARVHVNAPPVAVAGSDREGFAGGAHDHLLFDGSASSDADGQPLGYLWDLGDGSLRTGAQVLHAYAEAGEYQVRLEVTDGTGLTCGRARDELAVNLRPRDQVQAQR